jgi:hypothetical protein
MTQDIESKLRECNALHARLTALKRQIAEFAPAAVSVRSPTLKPKAGKKAV